MPEAGFEPAFLWTKRVESGHASTPWATRTGSFNPRISIAIVAITINVQPDYLEYWQYAHQFTTLWVQNTSSNNSPTPNHSIASGFRILTHRVLARVNRVHIYGTYLKFKESNPWRHSSEKQNRLQWEYLYALEWGVTSLMRTIG